MGRLVCVYLRFTNPRVAVLAEASWLVTDVGVGVRCECGRGGGSGSGNGSGSESE